MTSCHMFQLGRAACGWVQLLKCKSCTWISPFFQNSFSYCMCSFVYFQLPCLILQWKIRFVGICKISFKVTSELVKSGCHVKASFSLIIYPKNTKLVVMRRELDYLQNSRRHQLSKIVCAQESRSKLVFSSEKTMNFLEYPSLLCPIQATYNSN